MSVFPYVLYFIYVAGQGSLPTVRARFVRIVDRSGEIQTVTVSVRAKAARSSQKEALSEIRARFSVNPPAFCGAGADSEIADLEASICE